jgi:hypothetical protein
MIVSWNNGDSLYTIQIISYYAAPVYFTLNPFFWLQLTQALFLDGSNSFGYSMRVCVHRVIYEFV